MINFTHRIEDLLIQGEYVDRTSDDKKPFWRIAIADFHKCESCEFEASSEETVALIALAMGVAEDQYQGYWIEKLYGTVQEFLKKIPESLRPVP